MVLGIRGTAIDATEIAAIRDGDSQISDLPAELVGESAVSVVMSHKLCLYSRNKNAQFRDGNGQKGSARLNAPASLLSKSRKRERPFTPVKGGAGIFLCTLNAWEEIRICHAFRRYSAAKSFSGRGFALR